MFDPFHKRAAAVTCSDTVAFSVCRGLSVTTAGAYTVLLQGDTVAVPMNLAAGVIHKLAAKRVNATAAASVNGVVAFY
jgi:hypothetical protein